MQYRFDPPIIYFITESTSASIQLRAIYAATHRTIYELCALLFRDWKISRQFIGKTKLPQMITVMVFKYAIIIKGIYWTIIEFTFSWWHTMEYEGVVFF